MLADSWAESGDVARYAWRINAGKSGASAPLQLAGGATLTHFVALAEMSFKLRRLTHTKKKRNRGVGTVVRG